MEKVKNRAMMGCALILCLIMTSVLLRAVTVQLFIKRMQMDNMFIRAILFDKKGMYGLRQINWGEIYPFENNSIQKPESLTASTSPRAQINVINTKVVNLEKKVEAYATQHCVGYMFAVRMAKWYDEIIRWNVSAQKGRSSIVEMEDGHLAILTKRKDTTGKAEITTAFAKYCNELGIDFVYVAIPDKIGCLDKGYSGVNDFGDENTDEFLAKLSQSGVCYIDVRENIKAERIERRSLFYRTDPHWNAMAGLWAANIITHYLKDNFSLEGDSSLLDIENFREEVYKKCFFGQLGKSKQLPKDYFDDITLFYPRFETRFHYMIPSHNIDEFGGFDVIYDKNIKGSMCVNYNLDPYLYDVYNYGNKDYISIDNLCKHTGKILMIKDSFGTCVAPFLALECNHMDIIDLRYFSGSIKTFVKKEQPDIVIVLFHNAQLSYEDPAHFHFY